MGYGLVNDVEEQCQAMQLFKRIVGVFFCGVALLCLWWTGMNATGYCHAQGRYLSEQEMIDSAIQYTLNRYPPTISKKVAEEKNGTVYQSDYWYMPEKPVKYKDLNEFKAINPDCCSLSMRTGEGMPLSFLDRIAGSAATNVLVTFKVRYLDENQIEQQAQSGIAVVVKNCGKSWSGL